MKRGFGFVISLAVMSAAGPAAGGPDRVAFPENYAKNFTLYTKIDKTKKKEKVRFMYVNPAGLAGSSGSPPSGALPSGSIVVVEDHAVALAADGTPKTGSNGRLIPTDKIKNVFVMEKRAGWGKAYPVAKRNGDWEYAWFLADGRRKPGRTMEKCFACDKSRAARSDFVFTMAKLRAKAQAK